LKIKIRSPIVLEKNNKRSENNLLRDAFLGLYDGLMCPVGYVKLSDCPEIQTAANRIAELISSMTIHLLENSDLGDKRITNALSRKIDIEPNRYTNHKEFYFAIVKNMLLGNGNSIVYPKMKNGYIEDLIPFEMPSVSLIEDGYGYYVSYKGVNYKHDEVLHFRANVNENKPWLGQGYKLLLKDIATNLKQGETTKRKILESPKPSIVVKVDALTEEFASAKGREKLAEQYLSSSETGKPWLVPADLVDVVPISTLSLKDVAINETLSLDKRAAASIFGVPPYLVGVGEFNKNEFNNFIDLIILPIAKTIEQELSRKLLISENLFFKFNSRSLKSYNLSELVSAGAEMVDRVALSRNEWREWLGLPPNEDMQELIALENYIPSEQLGKQKKLVGNDEDNEDDNDEKKLSGGDNDDDE